MGSPEMAAAAWTNPELVWFPRFPGRRVAQLHLGSTALASHRQMAVAHTGIVLVRHSKLGSFLNVATERASQAYT
jgi:hypothetical protein